MKEKISMLIIFIVTVGLNMLSAQVRNKDRQQQPQLSSEIKVDAQHQYMDENKLIASGNVEIAWEDYRIFADYLEFNPDTKELLARGRVTMSSKETVLTGERLNFNLKKRTGEIYETYGQMPPTIRYTTDKLTQVDNDTLTFKKLDFTTCTQCVPRWKFTCGKGKIKKEKYIEMTNLLFKIKKIPVFYLPYIRYPIDKDGRATGILMPKFGTSSLRGFFLLNSFFWAIKPNVDLTLSVDYYARAGVGLAEEFRYLFKHMDGNIKFYFFNYKEGNIVGADKSSDYYLKMEHKQRINFLNTRITIAIDRQSDANFLRLFSNNFDSLLTRNSRSMGSIDSSFANVKLSISGMRNDTYYTFANRSTSLTYLPQIKVNWNQQKIWKLPGYFSLAASYSTMSRVGTSYDAEDLIYITDVTSTRLNLNPSYMLGLLRFPWLSAYLSMETNFSYYPQSKDPNAKGVVILDEPVKMYYHNADFTLKGPYFSKLFETRHSKFKHVIEPKIIFRYTTKVNDEDRKRLITVDYSDYPSYSYVGFSLTTRLLYKSKMGKSSPREILSYTISQDYFFDPELANRGRKVEGAFREFSQLDNTLRFRPTKDFSFDAAVTYNHYLKSFTNTRISLNYRNPNSPINGDFFYNANINQYATQSNYILNRKAIGGSLNINIPNFPLSFDSNVNYDITDKEFRLASFRFTYDYQCILFKSELKLFKYSGRVETQFNAGVSFGNLGMVKDFLGIDK